MGSLGRGFVSQRRCGTITIAFAEKGSGSSGDQKERRVFQWVRFCSTVFLIIFG